MSGNVGPTCRIARKIARTLEQSSELTFSSTGRVQKMPTPASMGRSRRDLSQIDRFRCVPPSFRRTWENKNQARGCVLMRVVTVVGGQT